MAGARIFFGNSGVYFGRDNTEFVAKTAASRNNGGPRPPKSTYGYNTLHSAWAGIAKDYGQFTTSSFTRPTDILPALSGLARLYGDQLKQEKYVAGHWVSRLHISLMWGCYYSYDFRDLSKNHDRQPFLLPTWSCLGQGRVVQSHISHPYWPEGAIVNAHAQPVGEDPYGAIHDAWIDFEGFVLGLESLSWDEDAGYIRGRGIHPRTRIWPQSRDPL